MTEHLIILQQFIDNNDRLGLKNHLDNLSETIKGKVFELFIAKLYNGNGWLAEVKGTRNDKGADILIRHPTEPTKVKFIIQAKNHKKKLNKKDTLSELNQFKEEARKIYNCSQYRLIALNGFVEDAYHFEKYNLRLESWEHLEKLLCNYNKERQEAPEIGLHSQNKITYNKIQELWNVSKRVSVIQATGTGKSYIIFKAISDFQGKQKILITPSKVIHNQFKENSDYGWLIDESVNSFLYQNRSNFTEENIINQKADLIILDEFHRIGASKWENKIKRLIECNPEAYILGTSATPIRYLDGNRDMAEEFFNGIKAAEITLPQAIVKRILPNPTYIASLISLEEEVENILINIQKSRLSAEEKEEYKIDLLQKQLDWENSKGVPEILKKHLTGKSLKKFVVFCEGIEHLDKMEIEVEKWFQKAGFKNRTRFRVHSKQTEKENKNIIKCFGDIGNNNVSLLFAVDMLNEGIHIESVDGVILLRPTESPIIFYQQIGRCLQVGNDNPIIFDLVNNFSSIKAKNFVNDLNEAKNQEGKELNKDGVFNDIPEFNVTDETKEIVELLDKISSQLNTWEVWFALLQSYYKEYGNSGPSHKILYNNEKIGYWVSEQRRKVDTLIDTQICRLNELEFDWGEDRKTGTIDRLENQRKYMKMLQDYYNWHKSCKIPKREPKTENGKKLWSKELATWFHHSLKPIYIKLYESDKDFFTYLHNGNKIPIIDFLNLIGIQDAFKKRTIDIAFERLEIEHGKNPLFNEKDFENIRSSDKEFYNKVVKKLRAFYHNNSIGNRKLVGRNYFKDGEIEKLESLGWTWSSKEIKTWDDYYKELKTIYRETGRSYFVQRVNYNLFQWCKSQRLNKENVKPEQVKKLNEIEFPWEVARLKSTVRPASDRRFEENSKTLPSFKDLNGDYKFKSGTKIYAWIGQLKAYGTTPEQKEILIKYGYNLDEELKKKSLKIRKPDCAEIHNR